MDAVNNTASTLHFILHCLIHAQLAKEFEDEFERYQLRLDLLQMRLSRWAEASGILSNKDSAADDARTISENQERTAAEILCAIQQTLRKARRDATKMRADLTADDGQRLDPEACASSSSKNPQIRIVGFFDKRRVQVTKMVGGLKWAFYKRDHFDRFITDLSALVSDLEGLDRTQIQGRA